MDYSNKYWQLKQAHPLTVLAALSACLPCHSACLVSLSALSDRLPCQTTCLVRPPALSDCLPCQTTCLVRPLALSACLPCQPTCFVWCQLLALLLLRWIFCQLLFFEQSILLRYLWIQNLLNRRDNDALKSCADIAN
jgi:hypothetical protein